MAAEKLINAVPHGYLARPAKTGLLAHEVNITLTKPARDTYESHYSDKNTWGKSRFREWTNKVDRFVDLVKNACKRTWPGERCSYHFGTTHPDITEAQRKKREKRWDFWKLDGDTFLDPFLWW